MLATWMADRSRLPVLESAGSKPNGQSLVSPADPGGRAASRRYSTTAPTARRAAPSPALCPPIPSATTQSPSRSSITKQSSLVCRTRPFSVTPCARSTPVHLRSREIASPRLVVYRPPALHGTAESLTWPAELSPVASNAPSYSAEFVARCRLLGPDAA